jgi:mRNA-decapping enzyme subunit 2
MWTSILSRFIVNLPTSELTNLNRILYHLELAHWWWCDNNNQIDSKETCRCSASDHKELQDFLFCCFQQPFWKVFPFCYQMNRSQIRLHYKRFLLDYKYKIPTAGLMVCCDSKVLLVQNAETKRWGFPKGKQNKGELLLETALRETEEETGIAFQRWVTNSCESRSSGNLTIFKIQVPFTSYQTKPKSLYEISDVRWFDLDTERPKLNSSTTQLLKLFFKEKNIFSRKEPPTPTPTTE